MTNLLVCQQVSQSVSVHLGQHFVHYLSNIMKLNFSSRHIVPCGAEDPEYELGVSGVDQHDEAVVGLVQDLQVEGVPRDDPPFLTVSPQLFIPQLGALFNHLT